MQGRVVMMMMACGSNCALSACRCGLGDDFRILVWGIISAQWLWWPGRRCGGGDVR